MWLPSSPTSPVVYRSTTASSDSAPDRTGASGRSIWYCSQSTSSWRTASTDRFQLAMFRFHAVSTLLIWPERARPHVLLGRLEVGAAAPLRADLDDPIAGLHDVERRGRIVEPHAERLLDERVLAGADGVAQHAAVRVIGRRDDHRVEARRVQEILVARHERRRLARQLCRHRRRHLLARLAPDVAEPDELNLSGRRGQRLIEQIGAAAAAADQADADPVVGCRADGPGGCHGRRGQADTGRQKLPSGNAGWVMDVTGNRPPLSIVAIRNYSASHTSAPPMRSYNGLIGLALVLCIAAWLRVPFITSGLPFFALEDEAHHFQRTVEMVKTGSFNPEYFNKPSLHFYLRMPVVAAAFVSAVKAGEIRRVDQMVTRSPAPRGGWAFTVSHPRILVWNRALGWCSDSSVWPSRLRWGAR